MTHRVAILSVRLVVALAVAGCGATRSGTPQRQPSTGHGHASTRHGQSVEAAGNPSAFAWLHPAPPPADWRLARLQGTAVMAYPPDWHRIRSDPGTVSAARTDRRSGLIVEYLNATPRQGDETLANWASFRPAHNRDEGDNDEQVLSFAPDLRFRDGQGSCVIDRYRTSATSYQEIACLVRTTAGQMVIVAAAQTESWARSAPALERAVSAFEA